MGIELDGVRHFILATDPGFQFQDDQQEVFAIDPQERYRRFLDQKHSRIITDLIADLVRRAADANDDIIETTGRVVGDARPGSEARGASGEAQACPMRLPERVSRPGQ